MAHTLASASTFSSASPQSNYSCDVFINHRGIDVKKTLASHLYRRLLSHGLRVFLDQPELKRGEKIDSQIERAIKTASVQVAIFSPGYANSRWCLDELDLMLKTDATIVPVFYNVKPSDLRWTDRGINNDRVAEALRILRQTGRYRVFVHALRILRWTGKDTLYVQALRNLRWTGSDRVYAEALLNHAKKGRYDQERLAAWRKALSDVSHISGFELEACNGDEGELVDEVARRVQKKVRKAPLHVARHPTGLDEKLQDFERTVSLEEQQHRGEPILLGIMGLGGVGKTTLAKEFFNRNRSHYQRSCFLADVRDAAARNTLTSLQGQLCEDLTGEPSAMCSIYEGVGVLSHLSYSQSLIVLDDVDHDEQLNALFSPVKGVLPSGSLILVTSRDKSVLRKSTGIEESSIYHMTGLGFDHSQELFCSYAFNHPHPAAGYEKLVRRFLNACHGLPLSLKVIGALLHLESPKFWKAQLRKLSQVLPTEIQSRLKISYDSLDKQEKEMFLDIACFFIGIKSDTAISLWDGSRWEGYLGLRSLQNKCLVEVDNQNHIRMHDHLRDLGRDLAEKEPLGGGFRMWRPTDNPFLNVQPQSTVRGISMVQQRSGESCQTPAEFSNCIVDISRLQLLRAPGDCLESLCKMLRHPELLWLRCEIYSFSSLPSWIQISYSHSLPSWIPIRNLRVLELVEHPYRSPRQEDPIPILGNLWNTESEAPVQLRELNISFDLLRLPKSIGQLRHLQKIELHNFKGTLPEEFFHLRSLKHLRLRAGMESLPDSLGNFTNLQHMDLSQCQDLQTLPPSLGNLTKLQYIDLSRCYKLQMLPPSFGNLTKLQHVKLRGCWTLKMLPDSFMNLIRLKHLDLDCCSDLTLSGETFGNISTLEKLNFSWCHKIDVLPPQVTDQQSLEELRLDCSNLEELPSAIGDLRNLEILYLYGLSLETLPHSLGKLTNLKILSLSGKLKYFPDWVGELKQLTSLRICYSPICEVPFANVEKVQGGRRLLDSSIDKRMLRLRSLELSNTRITEILFGEGVCPVLQKLNLNGCGDLVEVGALPITLTSLQLNSCCALKKITGLRDLAKLLRLYMSRCKEIEELPGLGVRELSNLEVLNLNECPISVMPFVSVEKVQGGPGLLDSSIDKCMLRLKELDLSKTRVTEISFGEGVCPVLQTLNLYGCDDLVEVGALPTTLTSLELTGCCALKKITGLSGLAKLRSLEMSRCKELEELPGLGVRELSNLEVLNLNGCPISVMPFVSVEKVQGGPGLLDSSIDKCMLRLKELNLWQTRVTEISFGEGVCPVLQTLNLYGCDDLVEVGALPTTLTSLKLTGCCALKKITGLSGLAKLRSLDMSGCKEIEELPGLGVWELKNLEYLNLQECPISVLPYASVEKVEGGRRLFSSIDECMVRLKSLKLSMTRITEMSFGEGVCPVLESLDLAGCDDLVEVGALPTTLTSLKLMGCCALKKITGLSGLAKLRSLDMSRCKEIEELPGVRELSNLEVLNLNECPISVMPFVSVEKVQGGPGLLDSSIDKCMVLLKSLKLSKTRISEISFGEDVCPVLKSLDLAGCDDLVEVGALPTTLTSLKLTGCCALKKITGLSGLAELRFLDISGCKEIEELLGLGVRGLTKLEELNLQECPISVLPFAGVEKVEGGGRLLDSSIDECMVRLKSLKLSKTRIREISFGEDVCPVLKSLDLAGCDDLVEVGALPTTLTSLKLTGCCALKKMTGLSGLAKLRSLDMSGCKEIEELPGLGVRELNNLEDLNLQECRISVLPYASVEKVEGDRRLLDSSIDKCMVRLNSLKLSRTRITEISFGEGVCPVLESLDLEDCDDLVDVGALPTTLISLKLTGCCALKKITGLRGLEKLRSMDMSGCKEIEELPGLGVRELNNLEDLNLQECPISVLPFTSVEKVEGGRIWLDSSIDKCMVRLKSLKLSMTRIAEISFGEGVCPVLESLDLAGCYDLVEVEVLPTTLTSLKLTGCCALKKITGLRGLAKLRSLDMSGCKEIEELPGLGVTELNNLEDLNLQECPITVLPFASVEKVQGGRRLLDSSIDKCMVRLKSLKLSMTRITEISFGEGVCPVLESLDLAGCDHLVEVGALPTTLTSLDLKDCCALMKITGLHGLAKLRHLDMAGCYAAAGSGNVDNGRSNH